ncbi:hypothetical protein CCACVL1_25992 [Corchorus capsularis]|uniref:Uncharacterized protein n=1 Tax=Corchorus capsularis TaxID=210143 RepID=A0A1R3GGA8_COCAP|nr:hypothetical protein CCACVL1_25992 [Corchorus capsularis]
MSAFCFVLCIIITFALTAEFGTAVHNSYSQSDSMKAEKANAYIRLRSSTNVFLLCFELILACKFDLLPYIVGVIANRHFVFVLCNVIIFVLIVEFRIFSAADS